MALPPLITIEPLKRRVCIPVLKCNPPRAKCFLECYDLCRDDVTGGINLFICLCPPFENKVNISQHSSVVTVLKYLPPACIKYDFTFAENI